MKTRILVFCPIKADATSYYRGWGPLNHLAKHEDIELIDISGDIEISWAVIGQGDILFMQRPSTFNEIRMMEIARDCNTPVWIDYDDDYLNIPPHNPRHELYAHPHRQEQVRRAIEIADIITVSTTGLKNAILEDTGRGFGLHANKIIVVPNAIDERMFELALPLHDDIEKRDVILWRGGDTHDHDMAPYIEKMVQLYNEFPWFKWAFMGSAPQEFLKQIDSSRVMLYEWEDVFVYFHRLLELKPRVTIVPWADNKFNLSKSNCSWLESTLAGAATVFPAWSLEAASGMVLYRDEDSFYAETRALLEDVSSCHTAVYSSTLSVPLLSSSSTYSTRKGIVSGLWSRKNSNRFSFNNTPYWMSPPAKPATDLEFFNYCHEKLHIQDNENYLKGHQETAQFLLDTFKPNSIVEIGCGPGPMIEYFLDKKIPQVKGFDLNPHFKDYFIKRNPHYADHFIVADFNDGELEGVFDLCISCEVFEHIPAEKANALIEKLSFHFKHFYFTSTPYHTSKKFDEWWGHRNINTHEKWVQIFEERGWKYEGNPHMLAPWDCMFTSLRAGQFDVITIGEPTPSSSPETSAEQPSSDSPQQSSPEMQP
jgi:SAM-dependent methyltransferase